VGGLLAKASHDLAEPHAAMAQARTGYLCADQTDHDGLRAWLRGLQSLIAYWAGRTQEAARYAESGGEFAARAGNTTAGYRRFVDQRRAQRPSEEYREPTDSELIDFRDHFQLRKVALGTCDRPYGTPCQHEHACFSALPLA
jgi:hypothetical protein